MFPGVGLRQCARTRPCRQLFHSKFGPGHSPNSQASSKFARQEVIRHLQNDPHMLRHAASGVTTNPLRWRTVVLLVAVSSSVSMAVYLGVEILKARNDPVGLKPRNVFLPLWFSFDWPYQRRFAFPDHLKYMDRPYYEVVLANENFTEHLHSNCVKYQVLDKLFRLTIVRDLLGIPLSLRSLEDDSFALWIEPKFPTVHGPQVHISKESGSLDISWQWAIKLLHWWSSVDGFLTGLGTKLDRIESSEALAKTHERGSGRVHEVVTVADKKTKRVVCGDRDYKVMFQGTFHVSHLAEKPCGVVSYTGVIDFDHLGISQGARIVQMDLTVAGEQGETIYKLS